MYCVETIDCHFYISIRLFDLWVHPLKNTDGTITKWTIQRNWQHRVHKTTKNKAKTQHYTQTNTNNVNTT